MKKSFQIYHDYNYVDVALSEGLYYMKFVKEE